MPTPDEPAAARPRRRIPPFVLVGVLGIVGIAVLVVREVSSIRHGMRDTDRRMAELDRQEAAADAARGDRVQRQGGEVLVRLTEVLRQGPDTPGRYHLDVGPIRWALEVPPAGADDLAWESWEASSRPRWEALAVSLQELVAGGTAVRAVLFAPWQDEPEAAPRRLLLRLLPLLAAAGVLDLDLEHVPSSLREGD